MVVGTTTGCRLQRANSCSRLFRAAKPIMSCVAPMSRIAIPDGIVRKAHVSSPPFMPRSSFWKVT